MRFEPQEMSEGELLFYALGLSSRDLLGILARRELAKRNKFRIQNTLSLTAKKPRRK